MTQITEDAFLDRFGPTLTGPDGSELWQYGELPSNLNARTVWSVTRGDDDGLYLSPGFHVVNMEGYVLATKPWTDEDMEIAVLWVEAHDDDEEDDGEVLIAGVLYDAETLEEAQAQDPLRFTLSDGPGAIRLGTDEEAEWEPADPTLVLEVCDIGPATVAQIDIAAVGFDGKAAATSIELTIEDIDGLIATLREIRVDAIANRGFAQQGDGYWTNGRA